MNRLLELARRRGVDVLIVAFAVAAEIELAFTHVDGPRWEVTLLTLGLPLPLLYRSRFPVAAPVAVYAASVLYSFVAPEAFRVVFVPFLAVLFTSWIFGSSIVGRRPLLAAVGFLAWAATISARLEDSWGSNFIFIVFVFGGACVAGFVTSHRNRQTAELRERAERAESERERLAAEAVAEERGRIARELHDVIAHSVSVMVVQAAGVRRLLAPEQDREREALLVVERIGRDALTEMRRMLGVLQERKDDVARAPQPGLGDLERLVEEVRHEGLVVDLEIDGVPVELPPGLDLSAYRIVQEGLADARRHPGRGEAHVRVKYAADELQLEVVDERARETGDGLSAMRERVAVYGGRLETGPAPAGGFRVCARLPLAGASR